jgi:hypothetical protein
MRLTTRTSNARGLAPSKDEIPWRAIWEARKNQDEDDDHDRVAANITGGDERSGLHNEA